MNVLSISRHIARKLAAQVDILEQMRQEIARLLQPRAVLVPIRIAVDRRKTARRRD